MPETSRPAPAPSGRKERKRLTDRIAQREHRRRQKEYVQELEAQLALINSGNSSDIATLVAENARLRAELQSLKELWKGIEDIVAKKNGPSNAAESEPVLDMREAAVDSNAMAAAAAPGDPSSSSSSNVQVSEPCAENVRSESTMSLAEDLALIGELSFPPPSPQIPQDSHLTLGGWWPSLHTPHPQSDSTRPSSFLNDLSSTGQQDWTRSNLEDDARGESRGPPRTGMMSMNNSTRNLDAIRSSLSFDDMVDIFRPYLQRPLSPLLPPFSQVTPLPHQKLPLALSPPMPKDYYLHNMIERGRASTKRPAPAVVTDFFFDNPDNLLSQQLKLYLEPIRSRKRTVEFFATYWVLYLMLRWQINQDEDSYRSLPKWLRPTEAQLSIPHPAAIDLIAWPALREKLLLLSFNDPPAVHETINAIGFYLEIDVDVGPEGFAMNSSSVREAITDIKNWKLMDGFFEVHPHFRGVT